MHTTTVKHTIQSQVKSSSFVIFYLREFHRTPCACGGRRWPLVGLAAADDCVQHQTAAVIRNELGGRPRGARRAAKNSSAPGRRAWSGGRAAGATTADRLTADEEEVGSSLRPGGGLPRQPDRRRRRIPHRLPPDSAASGRL